jgi:hypothetical protein
MKEQLITCLNKFGYEYSMNDKVICVKQDYAHNLYIDVVDENRIIFSDKLEGYNFLTGKVKMSLKKAMLYNSLSVFIFLVYFFIKNINSLFFSSIYILIVVSFSFWIILWTLYYHIKMENLKLNIINWLD